MRGFCARDRRAIVARAMVVAAFIASPLAAQPQIAGPPTVVATAGQRLTSTDPATTISQFGTIASDGAHVAANVDLQDGAAIASFAPGNIQTRFRVGANTSVKDGYRRLKLEHGFGIGASGAVVASAYSSGSVPNANSAVFGLIDTLWLAPANGAQSLIAVRGDKVATSGDPNTINWTFVSKPGVTDSGTPYWIGGKTGNWSTPTSSVGLYRGTSTSYTRLIGSGSGVVGGLTLDTHHPLRIAFLTPSGSRLYGVFGLAIGAGITSANDEVVGYRGAETTTALVSVLLREGNFVSGNAGEKWAAFDRLVGVDKSLCPGVNEWALLARTSADKEHDGVLVVNGQIVLREGGTVEGRALVGNPKDLAMNRQGDWAVLWKVREAASTQDGWLDRSALIINGRTALLEQATAASGATVTSLDGPICLGDRAMSGYADIGVVGSILPTGSNAVKTAALLSVHAMSGLAGCCPADLATGATTVEEESPDGKVTPADLALFISWYMAQDSRADLDNGTATGTPDGLFTEADLNYYLNHYFAGCLESI